MNNSFEIEAALDIGRVNSALLNQWKYTIQYEIVHVKHWASFQSKVMLSELLQYLIGMSQAI